MSTSNNQNSLTANTIQAMQCFRCQKYWVQQGTQLNCVKCHSEFVEIVMVGERDSFDGPIVKRQQLNNSMQTIRENSSSNQSSSSQSVIQPLHTLPSSKIEQQSRTLSSASTASQGMPQATILKHVARSNHPINNGPKSSILTSETQQPSQQICYTSSTASNRSVEPIASTSRSVSNTLQSSSTQINSLESNHELQNSKNEEKPKLMSIKDLKKLPRVYGKDVSKSSSNECSICCENFGCNFVLRQLKCKHIFHQKCLFPWLEKDGTCPICRFDLLEGKCAV